MSEELDAGQPLHPIRAPDTQRFGDGVSCTVPHTLAADESNPR
jgi:hypothetical protein